LCRMATFLIGILASAIIAVIYGAVFAQREEKIRGFLSAKREGWARRRYVKAFVGAVRGHAAAADTLMIGVLVLTIPFVLAGVFWSGAGDLKSRVGILDTRLTLAAQTLHEGQTATRESLEADLRRERGNLDTLKASADRLVLIMRAFSIVLVGECLYGLFFWLPFATMRRQFEREIDRFTLRIQGLASKGELAQLAMAESAVADEESLRSFVQIAAAIATRQGVPRLVDRFDLWAHLKET